MMLYITKLSGKQATVNWFLKLSCMRALCAVAFLFVGGPCLASAASSSASETGYHPLLTNEDVLKASLIRATVFDRIINELALEDQVGRVEFSNHRDFCDIIKAAAPHRLLEAAAKAAAEGECRLAVEFFLKHNEGLALSPFYQVFYDDTHKHAGLRFCLKRLGVPVPDSVTSDKDFLDLLDLILSSPRLRAKAGEVYQKHTKSFVVSEALFREETRERFVQFLEKSMKLDDLELFRRMIGHYSDVYHLSHLKFTAAAAVNGNEMGILTALYTLNRKLQSTPELASNAFEYLINLEGLPATYNDIVSLFSLLVQNMAQNELLILTLRHHMASYIAKTYGKEHYNRFSAELEELMRRGYLNNNNNNNCLVGIVNNLRHRIRGGHVN